jgi:hypothetical protein
MPVAALPAKACACGPEQAVASPYNVAAKLQNAVTQLQNAVSSLQEALTNHLHLVPVDEGAKTEGRERKEQEKGGTGEGEKRGPRRGEMYEG